MKQISQLKALSVNQIDELINDLENGFDSLLWFQDDINKVYKMQNLIAKLIDIRCEKLGINI